MWRLPLLFFLSPIIFVLTGKNVNDFIYGFIFFCVLASLVYKENSIKLSLNLLCALLVYCILISVAVCIGFYRGFSASIILKETLYYFKPLLFLFFGFLYLNDSTFYKLTLWGFLIVFLGSLIFYSDPSFYISKAIEKSPEGEGVDHFYSIHQNILRNSSLLLSPLETGYALLFFTSFLFIFYKGRWRSLILSLSAILLLLTLTRSAIIGFLVSLTAFKFLTAKVINKLFFLMWFSLLSLGVIVGYSEELQVIFLKEGSASAHLINLSEGIFVILRNPFGYGMGYSGFGSLSSTSDKFYSEGSLFTTLIEAGVLFAFFYICLFYYLYKVSKMSYLPVYIGFLVASVLIPIGFSTIFTCLFFSFLGILIRNDIQRRENSSNIN